MNEISRVIKSLQCASTLLFGDVLVAVAVVFCVRSLGSVSRSFLEAGNYRAR